MSGYFLAYFKAEEEDPITAHFSAQVEEAETAYFKADDEDPKIVFQVKA